MFDAQFLIADVSSSLAVYGPWMSRNGDYAVFAVELIAKSANATNIQFQVYHKNVEDAGDGVSIGSVQSISSLIVQPAERGPLMELVRFKLIINVGGAGGMGWALFRMLTPHWFSALPA
jgi:hypothetical protein